MNSVVEYNLDDIKEINRLLKEYRHDYMMYIRISIIKMVLEGFTRGEAADKFNVHRKSAENWFKIYNKEGISGLESDYSNCGSKSKLSDKQLKELRNLVINSDNEYDVNGVKILIKEKFNVDYSYKQVWFILRNKLGLNIKNKKIVQ